MRIRDEYLHGSDLTGVVKKIEVTTGTGNNANQSVIKYIKADSEGGVVEVPIGDITGKAATASKLDNTSAIGSKTNPVYFTANGVPSACTYSLNATVPAGAANQVLYYSATNTLGTQSYTTLTSNLDVFTVATSSAAGKKGLVPAPSANQLGAGNFFLRADGVWTVIENKTAALNGTDTSLVTTGEKYNWNSAYNWYNTMTSGDTDGTINKWKEVEAFLANYGDSSTLAAELAKLVTLSTDQTITGTKTFSKVINGSITGNADTVDGFHESDFFRRRDGIISNSDANDISLLGVFLNETGNGSNNSNYPEYFSDFFNFTAWYHTLFSCRSNFYWRTLLGNPAGKAWRTLLDSYNYTDYTVKKDGTGASGTWGIDISGNAATASNATSAESAIKSDYLTTRYIGSNGDTVAQVKLKILNSYTSLAGKQGYSIGVNSEFIIKYSDDNYVINPNAVYSLTYLTPGYDGKIYGQWLAASLGSERLYVFGRNDGLWTERKTIAWTSDIPTKVSDFENDAKYLTSHAYSYGSIDIYDINGAKKTSNNTVSASVNTETLRLQEGANISITAINSGDPGSDIIKIAVTGIESNINQNGYGQLALWKNGASSVSATLQSATYNEKLTVKAGSGIDFSGVNGTANNDVWTISAIPYNCAITLSNNSSPKSLIKDSWSADKDSVYLTSNGTSGGTSLAAGTYALWIEDRSTDSGTPNYYSGIFTCAGSAAAGRLDEIALHSSMATNADTNAPTRIFVATQISGTSGKHVLRFCSLDSKATPHYLTVKVNRII